MELQGIEHFAEYLGEVVSVTSDMGPESGLHSFRISSLLDCFPPWFQASLTASPPKLLTGDEDDDPKPIDIAWDAPKPWMDTALQIPGALHIIDNLQKDLTTALPFWSEHVQRLKAFQPLLHDRHYRERLQHTCLRGVAAKIL